MSRAPSAAPATCAERELRLARAGCALLDREEAARAAGDEAAKAAAGVEIDALRRWCAAHVHDPALASWVVFRFPETVDYEHLVHIVRPDPARPQVLIGPEAARRRRDGFALTDPRAGVRDRLNEIHYCVICHERDKDSCSKGITDKQGAVVTNPLGIALAGCPLDEKISEMHLLRKRGDAIGSLALVMIDNPMCPGTGHRICNDCMKACIYQKQDPVDIPQVETGTLTDVLQLPWGVEIYGLLTRWNPLNVARPYALPVQRAERAGRRPRPGRLHAVALPGERGLRRGGHRRAEDRAARSAPGRRPGAAARADRPLVRHLPSRSTSACSKVSAASPSTASRCAGTRTSCRSSTSRWPGGRRCASTAASASAGRCRSTRSGATASTTWPSPPAPAGRRSSTSRTT